MKAQTKMEEAYNQPPFSISTRTNIDHTSFSFSTSLSASLHLGETDTQEMKKRKEEEAKNELEVEKGKEEAKKKVEVVVEKLKEAEVILYEDVLPEESEDEDEDEGSCVGSRGRGGEVNANQGISIISATPSSCHVSACSSLSASASSSYLSSSSFAAAPATALTPSEIVIIRNKLLAPCTKAQGELIHRLWGEGMVISDAEVVAVVKDDRCKTREDVLDVINQMKKRQKLVKESPEWGDVLSNLLPEAPTNLSLSDTLNKKMSSRSKMMVCDRVDCFTREELIFDLPHYLNEEDARECTKATCYGVCASYCFRCLPTRRLRSLLKAKLYA